MSSIIILILSVTSCNLPFKIVPNDQNTQAPLAATTPPPPDSSPSAEVTEGTPEPLAAPDLSSIVPVTGSVLRWIDLSDFVYVPEGKFTMGQDSDTPSDHAPAHQVNLASFWIQQSEVTNQQYAACVSVGACTEPAKEEDVPYWYPQPSRANNPVVGVTWQQAGEYCDYIHGRLPTEAEWEKAARGTENTAYPWGEDKPNCELLNFDNCLDPSEPEDVRAYNNGAGEYKTMDMSGNVFEWVNDWYAQDFYATSPAVNPTGPTDGTLKVFRGGGYASPADDVNAFTRFSAKPEEHAADLGFRCVLMGDAYSASGGNSQVPRSCSVLPVSNNQPVEQATITPIPCQQAVLTGQCHINKQGNPITYFTIYQANCDINELYGFESNTVQNLDCVGAPFSFSKDPKTFDCSGTNMFQGSTVDVTFCHTYEVLPIYTNCPPGYQFNSNNFFCEPTGTWAPDPPCPLDYIEFGGICMPNPDNYYDGCPVGFYKSDAVVKPGEIDQVCIPFEDCLWDKELPPCNAPVCPEGQTYDEARDCCAAPAKQKQVCLSGLSTRYDPVQDKLFCEIPEMFNSECETHDVTIKYCPTLTPTPTTPPAGGNPGQNCYCDPKIISFCSMICE